MTTVTIYTDKSDCVRRFQCSGHANFRRYGKDIICAAVSLLVINTVNSIEELTGEAFRLDIEEKNGLLDFSFSGTPSADATLLIRSMILGLKEIEKEYGNKYLKLKFEEV